MCGISLVLSGDHFVVAPSAAAVAAAAAEIHHSGEGKGVSVDELKEALHRRGPDNLGCLRRRLLANGTVLGSDSCNGGGERKANAGDGSVAELLFIGATLHLRGAEPVAQPLVSPSGSVLVYNEIKPVLAVQVVTNQFRRYFPQSKMDSNMIWFGRDAFGRRSLLVHWSTSEDSRFILSSVAPPSFARNNSDATVNVFVSDTDMNGCTKASYWEELPCGIYSIHMKDIRKDGTCVKEGWNVEVNTHEWMDSSLNKLIEWERKLTVPTIEDNSIDRGNHLLSQNFISSGAEENSKNGFMKIDLLSDSANCITQSAHKVLVALRESVMLRTKMNTLFQGGINKPGDEEIAPIAVLFSGGLDSMILAALLNQCIDSKWTIDLLNVSFDGQLAPDRISAIAGLRELQRIYPLRRWRLVEIDTALTDLKGESEHVMALIHPSDTYMDLNIGIALWLAAGGDGWVDGSACLMPDGSRHKYKSSSRVLIVGSGADEQCAGYGRHRSKYRLGGWNALDEEMRLDVQRIWKRNMGRDDRCISDHGKEARFPFLDENVIKTLLEIPLWEVAKLDEPVGKGDKKILREQSPSPFHIEGCKAAGSTRSCSSAKASNPGAYSNLIFWLWSFGSRIARESNRKNFGSNRAANQASAGSVQIHKHMQ
nr:unnamed protein product [Digitaria exilis]